MFFRHFFCSALFTLTSMQVVAEAPAVGHLLPALSIADRGELFIESDDFGFRPWSTEQNLNKVHIVQYFGATKSDSELFKPFTDRLQELIPGTYHVTTIVNLDAALWGTSSFVISELKSNKRKYPLSTIVLDEDGSGLNTWQLGKQGAGLVILDQQGVVKYFTKKPMTETEMSASLDMVKSNSNGAIFSEGPISVLDTPTR